MTGKNTGVRSKIPEKNTGIRSKMTEKNTRKILNHPKKITRVRSKLTG